MPSNPTPSPPTSTPSSVDSTASPPSKRKELGQPSSSSSSLPQTTLLLSNGTHLNLLAPSPFEPLTKGARWPESHLEILKTAFDQEEDTVPLSLRRPLALYLSVPYSRVVRWIYLRKEELKKTSVRKDESRLAEGVKEEEGEREDAELEETSSPVLDVSFVSEVVIGEGEERYECSSSSEEDDEVGSAGGGSDGFEGEEVARSVRQDEENPTSSTSTNAYTQFVASAFPSSPSPSSLQQPPINSPFETPHVPPHEIFRDLEPPKTLVLSPSNVLALFNTLSRLSLPTSLPSLPSIQANFSSSQGGEESSTGRDASDLDLLISFDQLHSSQSSSSSSLTSNFIPPSLSISPEDPSLVALEPKSAPKFSENLTLDSLARQRQRQQNQEEQRRSDASVISSSSFIAFSPLAFGTNRLDPVGNLVASEPPSVQPSTTLKRKASAFGHDPLAASSSDAFPPSKLVKLSLRPNEVGAAMDDTWLREAAEGWFGVGWRWKAEAEGSKEEHSRGV